MKGGETRVQQGQSVAVTGLSLGSIVHFRRLLLKALLDRGHAVTVYAPVDGSQRLEALTELGAQFRDIPLDRTGTNPFRDAGTIRALFDLWGKARPDVLLNCAVKPALYGSLAAHWRGVPQIFSLITGRSGAFSSEHGASHSLVEFAARLLCRYSLAHNRVVFFQNPDDQEFFRSTKLINGPTQTVLVNGSGVDLEFYRPTPVPEHVSFILIARLIGEKGIREYVEAARIVRAAHPTAAFRLAGAIDRSRASISNREIESWVAGGIIEYLGRLTDVRDAISRSSVFVLPSYFPEGQPRSLLEALAMGRPIITTDWTGCRETVAPGCNGFLVPPRDVPSLADAMRHFIEHPDQIERMGRESRRRAESKYDVHEINRVMLEAMELT